MTNEKAMARHYLETGVLGAYETAQVVHEENIGGKCVPCFEDALVVFDKTQNSIHRNLMIGGRRFRVCSVFPSDIDTTPTDKLLGLIKTE